MAKYDEIQVDERLPLLKSLPLSLQHLFAMFGSTVLVPVIFGINPAIILLMNGVGTLFYIFITKGKIPAYLGSSFAFISPVTVVMGKYAGIEGYGYVLGGFLVVGRSEEHTSELQSRGHLVCRLLLEKEQTLIKPVY